MIGLLRNGVICTVKDADMPILFCTFSHLLSPPFRVNMGITEREKTRNYGCPEPRQDAARGERVCRHRILGGWNTQWQKHGK